MGGQVGAQIVTPPEKTVADTGDEVVGQIPQGARNRGHEGRQRFPSSSKPPDNVNPGIGAQEQGAVMGLHDHAVGQPRAPANRNGCLKCLSLQRGESEGRSQPVMLQDKLHPAMTQPAMPIVEKDLGVFGGMRRTHDYNIAQIRAPACFERPSEPTRGSAADQGVRPT